ncbi:MAG: AHH domain-containing protein [Pseudomonadota bacterium]
MAAPAARGPLSFGAVNAPGAPGYRAGMQRHQLLPRQLLTRSWFSRLVDSLGRERLGIDDFRSNGLLLPAVEQAAQVLGLPLHRGPHTHYNQVVLERVGQIEAGWQTGHLRNPDLAQRELVMRLHLLQQALRRSLLQPRATFARLNLRDPRWQTLDFSDLDAMAEALWAASDPKP